MSVIKRGDVLGHNSKSRSAPPALSPEQKRALELLADMDSGMSLLRFQVEVSGSSDPSNPVESELAQAIGYLNDAIDNAPERDRAGSVAKALQYIAVAVDKMDMSLEDVALEAVNELR